MKAKKCRIIQVNKKDKLWRAYKTLYLEIERFDLPKDAADIQKEKQKPVPVGMLPAIF
jgi:hypothetical protein